MAKSKAATMMAGVPAVNKSLYHAIRFRVGDPAALLVWPGASPDVPVRRLLILRDIEMDRARQHARADAVACPADFTPEGGLSGDRETATAQAAAECLRREGVTNVIADRTLPLIFAHHIIGAGIEIAYDADLGVAVRRAKDEQEIACLREAQAVTERAIELACTMIANAESDAQGVLQVDGVALTADRVRYVVDTFLLEAGYTNPGSIVACGPDGGDCHNMGAGDLRTGQPVIIDVFPCSRASGYNGDCTRTVVHGDIPDAVVAMHRAVLEAKANAIAATRSGVTGQDVHDATIAVIEAHGYAIGAPTADHPTTMPHGTGHGVGLDVHEPPLLDRAGPGLVVGDALTIEPGLYNSQLGGVRIEDMVIVTDSGCDNLNALPESLDWRSV